MMSLAMRQARFSAVGDPGLFGFLGKAIGTVAGVAGNLLPGPAGLIAKGVSSALTPKSVSQAKQSLGGWGAVNQMIVSRSQLLQQPATVSSLPGFSGVKLGPIQIGTSKPGVGAVTPPQLLPAGGAVSSGPLVGNKPISTACTAGYHFNKSRYYSTKYGVVEKGTVCVKNRRRNPLNPRALSRAMSRVKSAQKAVRCLQLFAGPAARASAKARPGGKRSGGKCRTCK